MPPRYPGYDVLSKRNTPSWNEITRRVVDRRIAVPREPEYFAVEEYETLNALCQRIVPQAPNHKPVPLAAMLDHTLVKDGDKGFRVAPLPYQGEAWRRGLRALDAEAVAAYDRRFHLLSEAQQDALVHRMAQGELANPAWGDIPCKLFFTKRVLPDIPAHYYAHPTAWNEIGWGGPASPRGYVRTAANRRDPWEAAEAKPGEENKAFWKNQHVG